MNENREGYETVLWVDYMNLKSDQSKRLELDRLMRLLRSEKCQRTNQIGLVDLWCRKQLLHRRYKNPP